MVNTVRIRLLRQASGALYIWDSGLGFLGVLVGTAAAIYLVPNDPSPKGALFWSGFVMAAGLAAAPLHAGMRNPKAFVQPPSVVMLAPIYWLLLDLIQRAYPLPGVYRSETVWSFAAIGLFGGTAWIGLQQRPWRLPQVLARATLYDAGPGALFGLALVSFGLGIFRYAYPCGFNPVEMLTFLNVGRWSGPWSHAPGDWTAFIDHMEYFGFLLPALLVALAGRLGWLNIRTLVIGLLSLFFALFVAQGGGRRYVGVFFGIALIQWLLSRRRFKTRNVVIAAGAVASLLSLMQLILIYRNTGLAAALDGDSSGPPGLGYIHVDDNFYRLTQTLRLIPGTYPHTGVDYFVYIMARPIPRVLWPRKPLNPGFELAAAVGMTGVSLSSSVIGELYVAGGFPALLVGGWLLGRFGSVGKRLLRRKSLGARIIYSAWMMALFVGMRSLIDLVLFSYIILAWVAIVSLLQLAEPMHHQLFHRALRKPSSAVQA
jgi:hypothetical protein